MTLPRAIIQHAAMWDEDICLDCNNRQDPPLEGPRVCEACGGTQVLPATVVLLCSDFIEEDET